MRVINNLKIKNKCLGCEQRSERFFCNLSENTLKTFEAMKVTNYYPKGATIFNEGYPSNGVYMLCHGRVKLTTCSRDGKVIILRVAEPGEVLGLSAVVSDCFYKATAEVIEPCQVNFIRKEDFLRLLEQNAEVSLSAVRQLSHNYHSAYVQIRSFGLSTSVADKLAKLILGWCQGRESREGKIFLKIYYTHEEIAEMIGTSRETVSRALKDFRERNLVTQRGSDLIIHDKSRLESAIGARHSARH